MLNGNLVSRIQALAKIGADRRLAVVVVADQPEASGWLALPDVITKSMDLIGRVAAYLGQRRGGEAQ